MNLHKGTVDIKMKQN